MSGSTTTTSRRFLRAGLFAASGLLWGTDASAWQPGAAADLIRPVVDAGRLAGAVVLVTDAAGPLAEEAMGELSRRQTPATVPESDGRGFSVGGDGSFGHGGAHATNMTIDPRRGIATVWMVQDAGTPAEWRTAEGKVREWAVTRFGKESH